MIQETRVKRLNDLHENGGRFVAYWMQASQRALDNHALEFAVDQANRLRQPLFVFFILFPGYPSASLRQYLFMLQGLDETKKRLAGRRIPLIVRTGYPPEVLLEAAADASLVITDRGYLDILRRWRAELAASLPCPFIQVESDAVIPVETACPREAYSAAVLRPRILRLLFAYLVPLSERDLMYPAPPGDLFGIDISDPPAIARMLGTDSEIGPVPGTIGGTEAALYRLDRFIREDLDSYGTDRNDPAQAVASHLSPYLHFGQISPLTVARAVAAVESPGKEAFLEELIVRRELAVNFTEYNRHYDTFSSLPDWAGTTLLRHARDRREPRYTPDILEAGKTHDRYWNAAQRELRETGGMHGYIRMYWGKKILQWTASPEEAYTTAVFLNDRYALDGRDPNGYAGVAWCFGKHDRPWKERDIFGSVRYMNDKGLERKFDMSAYLSRVGFSG